MAEDYNDLDEVDGDKRWWRLSCGAFSMYWFDFCTLHTLVHNIPEYEKANKAKFTARPACNADKDDPKYQSGFSIRHIPEAPEDPS